MECNDCQIKKQNQTHWLQKIDMIDFNKTRNMTNKSIGSREHQFKGSMHQKSPENAVVQVPLLWLTKNGVLQSSFS